MNALMQSDMVESDWWPGKAHGGGMARCSQLCENGHIWSRRKSKFKGHMGGKNLWVAITAVANRICTCDRDSEVSSFFSFPS